MSHFLVSVIIGYFLHHWMLELCGSNTATAAREGNKGIPQDTVVLNIANRSWRHSVLLNGFEGPALQCRLGECPIV